MQIKLPDKFPCFCCHDRNAVNFINVETDSIDPHRLRLPVCDKCTEYAQRNPTWLEEALLLRCMKALNNNNQTGGFTHDRTKV